MSVHRRRFHRTHAFGHNHHSASIITNGMLYLGWCMVYKLLHDLRIHLLHRVATTSSGGLPADQNTVKKNLDAVI